jgi:hypothetical protein
MIGSASMSARSPITRPAAVGAPPDHGHDAGATDALRHLVTAERAAKLGHAGGGAVHLEQQFGMFVEIPAPGGDLGQQVRQSGS